MSLAERLAIGPPRAAKGCKFAALRNSLNKPERKALDEMLDSEHWSVSEIVRSLHEEGYKIGVTVVKQHARGECACRSLTA